MARTFRSIHGHLYVPWLLHEVAPGQLQEVRELHKVVSVCPMSKVLISVHRWLWNGVALICHLPWHVSRHFQKSAEGIGPLTSLGTCIVTNVTKHHCQ